MFKKIVAMVAVAAVMFGSSFVRADENKIVMDGSTTVGPIAKAFAEAYKKENPEVDISVSESGSGNGAKSLINSTCDIANMSRFMKEKEFKAAAEKGIMPVAHVVAMDGLAVIVHPSNSVRNLTMDQLQKIYLGEIKNWSEVGGPNKPVVIISRDTNSGTFETFHKLVMKKKEVADSAEKCSSNGAVKARVQSTQYAIGYVGLGYVDRKVKDVTVNNMAATPRTVATGSYPIARPLYMFTNGYPKLGTHVHKFITYYLTPKGQKIIEDIGFVPVTMYK